jgi:hypothetical protein
MTLATDYVLGTLAGVCAVLLVRQNAKSRQKAVGLWALALGAAAMGSFTGGAYHGFQQAMPTPVAAALWKTTTVTMGVASFFLLSAGMNAAFTGRTLQWLMNAAVVKLGIYALWMSRHDEFRFVIYDYGSTLAMLMLLAAGRRTHGIRGHRAYIVSGILVSIAAAGVQQAGVRLHRHFNHNDLMHVIQMGGMWLLYKGGARLRDAGGSDASQP